jgi:hypothetical protein
MSKPALPPKFEPAAAVLRHSRGRLQTTSECNPKPIFEGIFLSHCGN